MPKLFNIDDFCKDLPEVTDDRLSEKKRFSKGGLFSEQIFGPIVSYTCHCDKEGIHTTDGSRCKVCEIEHVPSSERRRRFAKIVLPFPVLNPIMYDLVKSVAKSDLEAVVDKLLTDRQVVLYKDKNGELVITNKDSLPKSVTTFYERMDAVKELIKFKAESLSKINRVWKIIKNNIDKLTIENVIVLPPDLRPGVRAKDSNLTKADPINKLYDDILKKKNEVTKGVTDPSKNIFLFYNFYPSLQKSVNELYNFIITKLSKKEGIIRKNILGKRVNFSGRATICPDPTLSLDECVLPYYMFLEIYKFQVAERAVEKKLFSCVPKAITAIEKETELNTYFFYDICKEISQDEVCLLNRQPSLHRLSMIGFKIKVSKEDVIRIHPLVCAGYNADFDGDQMAVYVPISKEAKTEIREKFFSTKNLTNITNGELATLPSQDIVLGIYALTSNKIQKLKPLVECKGEKVPKGVAIFNSCLPEDFPLVKKEVTKNELISILTKIKNTYDEETTKKVLDSVKEVGFKYSTILGVTLSLDLLEVPMYKEIQEAIYKNKNISKQIQLTESKKIEDFLKRNCKVSYLVYSGSRGSWDQLRQIVLTRGFVSNYEGQIVRTPIMNCYLDGLTQEEFFISCYGARKGLLDVALKTGAAGYLSRKLIFTCANLELSDDLEDCETKDYLDVFVNSEKKARMLVYRYFLGEDNKLHLITPENYMTLLNKKIKVRSPIYCKSEKVCKKCYGELPGLHTNYIGIIAAQALGESNTQLILRTFHTSGAAKTRGEESLKQQDIIADLSKATFLLHKSGQVDIAEHTAELFELYNTDKRSIYHVHIECVVAQRLWNGNKKWRLLDNRNVIEPLIYSVQSVPEKENWLLGVGFSNPKKHILQGICNRGNYRGILNKILRGRIIDVTV